MKKDLDKMDKIQLEIKSELDKILMDKRTKLLLKEVYSYLEELKR